MTDLTLPHIRLSSNPVPPVAADITLLLSAYSFISPLSGRLDPRARAAFDAVATAYCNGAQLLLPLPKDRPADVPLFLDLWKRSSVVTEVPQLELSDEAFDEIAATCSDAFVTYAEGTPDDVARWIAFQFSDQAVEAHLTRSDMDTIRRAGPLAAELLRLKRLPKLTDAILRLQGEGPLQEPGEYEWMVGSPDLPSFIHLCLAYALSVAFRGYSYALGVGQLPNDPAYRHHWIRSPVLRTNLPHGSTRTADQTATWFPWGALLTAVFDPRKPLAKRRPERVAEVLDGIRASAPQVRHAFAQPLAEPSKLGSISSKLTDRDQLILDVLRSVDVTPRYSASTGIETLAEWLRGLVKERHPIWQVPIEVVLAQLQPEWLRKLEAGFRARFRRDRFWDVFEDPGLRRVLSRARADHHVRANDRMHQTAEPPSTK